MEFQDRIRLPSNFGYSQLSAQSVSGEGDHSGSSAKLAEEALVPTVEHQRTMPSATDSASTDAGTHTASNFEEAQADGLGLERQRLTSLGCLARVTDTLMRTWKDSTNIA